MTSMLELPLAALVGFATSAPTGPINLLCARRTLRHGFWPGFSAGLGAAAAESIYAALSVGGLTLASERVAAHVGPLRALSGLALLALALLSWRSAPGDPPRPDGTEPAPPCAPGVAAGSLGTFALTLLNPVPLVSMGFGLAAARALSPVPIPAFLEFLGLVAGVVLWWTVLTATLARVRHRLDGGAMLWLNRGVAVALAAFGLAALSGALV